MTRLESLQKALLVWRYIVEHPVVSKKDVYAALGLERDIYWCACCEYAQGDCRYCPAWSYDGGDDAPCAESHSPCIIWLQGRDNGDRLVAMAGAQGMVTLLERALTGEKA